MTANLAWSAEVGDNGERGALVAEVIDLDLAELLDVVGELARYAALLADLAGGDDEAGLDVWRRVVAAEDALEG